MMGYLFIFLAVLWNVAKGYSSKRVSGTMKTVRESIVFNTARSFLCCVFALLFVLLKRIPNVFAVTLPEAVICIISGVSMAVFTTVWILALKTDAYMLVSACGSASFIVPCLWGLFFLEESFSSCSLVLRLNPAEKSVLFVRFSVNSVAIQGIADHIAAVVIKSVAKTFS